MPSSTTIESNYYYNNNETLLLADTTSITATSKRIRIATNTTTAPLVTSLATARSVKMNYHNMIILLALLLCGLTTVNGLKCYMCGQYNEGVGSITPCLNYSDQYAHLYLKECSKPTEKYCVKYVSELSTVRDCATECVEKEIWETQTYCCIGEGCNGSNNLEISAALLMFTLICAIYHVVVNTTFRVRC